MKPSLVLRMRLSGSVKLRCALVAGSSDGGAPGLPGFVRLSPSRCFCFCASIRRSSSAAEQKRIKKIAEAKAELEVEAKAAADEERRIEAHGQGVYRARGL